ncbi:MAG TPA: hypothetical protein PLS69_01160, partial [Terricaulis sp.]|nr:hypothetical protein [Terricaulis sp.]
LERLADAIALAEPPPETALARLIGRPQRDLAGVLGALTYRRIETEAGARWAGAAPKRAAKPRLREESPFAALAQLMPDPPRRRRRRRKSA